MHGVHQLGGRSYSYAPDEFERHLEKENPGLLGGCKLDSHKTAQTAAGFLEEVSRFHHADGSSRAVAATAFSAMTKKAFDEVAASFVEEKQGETLHELQLKKATASECEAMAGGKDYTKVFRCEVDQPRFWLPWFGAKGWKSVWNMDKDKPEEQKLRSLVFKDACCQHVKVVPGVCPAPMPVSKEGKPEESAADGKRQKGCFKAMTKEDCNKTLATSRRNKCAWDTESKTCLSQKA